MQKVIISHSGGLDSTVVLYHYLNLGYTPIIVNINYGQKAVQELRACNYFSQKFGLKIHNLRIEGYERSVDNNVLVRGTPDEVNNIAATVVSARNAVFLAIASGIAEAEGADIISYGTHLTRFDIFPDCSPDFVEAYQRVVDTSVHRRIELQVPLMEMTKTDVVRYGATLGVEFEKTYSCYSQNEYHCGVCISCLDRIKAFKEAGIHDPTRYATQ